MAVCVQLSKFGILLLKYKWPLGCSFQNFIFCCKKANGRLSAVFKILYFPEKKKKKKKNGCPFG